MKSNSQKSRTILSLVATIGLTSMFFLVGAQNASAQWNASPSPSPNTNIYYNAGNVGIGTSSPTVPFEVNHYARMGFGSGYILVGNPTSPNSISGANYDRLRIGFESNVLVIGTDAAGTGTIRPIKITTGGNTGLNVDTSGNVGIGVTTPGARLHVTGAPDGWGTAAFTGSIYSSYFNYNGDKSEDTYIRGGKVNSKVVINDANGGNVLMALQGGNVGIGASNPTAKFQVAGDGRFTGNLTIGGNVQSGQINSSGGFCIAGDCKTAWSQVGGSQWSTSTNGANISYSSGNVGIGITTPSARLQVSGVGGWGTAAFTGSIYSSAFNYNVDNSEDTYIRGGKVNSKVVINDANGGNVLMVLSGGNVGIGASNPTAKFQVAGDGRFTGNLTVDGSLAAKYQDVAEWVPSSEQLSAGTVVVLDSTTSNQVTSSGQSYDTRVAGVVSDQPGITLGEKGDHKVLVATTGRLRVKVDASNSPIQIGDLLVTSNVPGFAMKSEPIMISGRAIHAPGTLIGKALEPLARGKGEILVLLSLQ